MQDYYDQLSYHLPIESADSYAAKALRVLEDIEFNAPDFYQEFLRSDIVLSLSGVRALGADLESTSSFHDGRQTAQLYKVLSSHGIEVLNFAGEQVFICLRALSDLPRCYKLNNIPATPTEVTEESFRAWVADMQQFIAADIEPLASQTIEPSQVWLGMLHGYPGPAIMHYVSEQKEYINTDIPHARDHAGASINYHYSAAHDGNKSIDAHQKLWGDILTKIYDKLP